MTEVVIAGIGQTPLGEQWDASLRELAFWALDAALQDAGGLQPQALFVGNMLAPQLSHQANVGTLVADFAGLTGIEAVTVEAAGASGGAALRAGYLAVKAGMADVALVLGVEKFSDQPGGAVEEALATTGDGDYEAPQGSTPLVQAALLMQRYLHESGAPHSAFAGFALNAHANGARNPNAMFQRTITAETYEGSGVVSTPLNLFDVAPHADGAAAVVLTRPELLGGDPLHHQVRIAASSMTSDRLALHDRPDPLDFRAARLSVEQALARAGITREQLDFLELHDAYSIYGALALEAAGFAGRGEGWRLAAQEYIGLHGRLPLNTFGGMKARGDAGGASGLYAVVEAVLQLRGAAGANQVAEAHWGLVQSLGGPAAAVATHILTAAEGIRPG
jgi:acetyl-CoA C-acetyltransferase